MATRLAWGRAWRPFWGKRVRRKSRASGSAVWRDPLDVLLPLLPHSLPESGVKGGVERAGSGEAAVRGGMARGEERVGLEWVWFTVGRAMDLDGW